MANVSVKRMDEGERSLLLDKLEQGLETMGLALEPSARERLIDYVLLLAKWNKAYNLSAIRDPLQMVSRHLLDSLSLLPRVAALKEQAATRGETGRNSNTGTGRKAEQNPGQAGPFRVLDVGTGAGLPGIPLAICLPDVHFFLLDSNGKKTRFVFQALTALKLDNAKVVHTRIENYQSPGQIAIVVSRAFASLADFVRGCSHLCSPETRLLAMKGLYPDAEIAELPAAWQVIHSELLEVPETDGQRHLLELQRQDP